MREMERIMGEWGRERFEALRVQVDKEDWFPGVYGEPVEIKPDYKAKELVEIVFNRLKENIYFLTACENCPELSQIEKALAQDFQKYLDENIYG
jgi:hypothetical protein